QRCLVAPRAAGVERPTGTRAGHRIGRHVSGLSGEQPWGKAGAAQDRMSRNPLRLRVPVSPGRWSFDGLASFVVKFPRFPGATLSVYVPRTGPVKEAANSCPE